METAKGKKWYYANGFQLAQCRKLCELYFDSFFFRAESDEIEMVFNIFVYKTIKDDKDKIHKIEDYINIERFKELFCNKKQWRLTLIEKESG